MVQTKGKKMHCHVTMDQAKPFPQLSSVLRVHLNKLIVRGKRGVKEHTKQDQTVVKDDAARKG
jgi:hypothetical protein